jgi:hypothetical protein
MKRTLTLAFLCITLVFLLTSCRSTGPGPATWIDKPLDRSSYPLEPLEIIAHASSAKGVQSIEFVVDDQVISTVRVGSGRFELASQVWQPEEPGVYTVKVVAIDTGGTPGSQAVSIVYIGETEIEGVIQGGPWYGDCDYLEVFNFVAEPPVIPPGECSNLFWEVISPGDYGVIVEGEGVPPMGEMMVCPDETRPFELIVESATGICRQWQTVYIEEGFGTPRSLFFEAHPPLIQRGECSILIWEILPQGERLPELQGMEVPFQGEMEVCPDETTPYFLTSEVSPELVAIVEVIDEGENPDDPSSPPDPNLTPTFTMTPDPLTSPTPTPTPGPGASSTPTQTPGSGPTDTPIPDAIPPLITNALVSPDDFIYNTNGSCSPTYFQFSVKVTDAGGISSVSLNWTGTGVRSGPVAMNYSGGGGVYFKNLGLFVNTGSLSSFSITATDNAGNSSTINPGWSLDVEECGG